MSEDGREAKRYSGWARSFSARVGTADDAKAAEQAWIEEITSDWETRHRADLVENLLWAITAWAEVTCVSDQWCAVRTEGPLPDASGHTSRTSPRFETFIQGDRFAWVLAETYRVWKREREAAARR